MAYKTISPYTGKEVKSFPTATDFEVDAALAKAQTAFESWRTSSFAERADVMSNVAKILRENADEYARLISLEMGKLLSEAQAEVELSAQISEYYAEHAAEQLAPRVLAPKGYPEGSVQLVSDPLGVLYIVEPWNFPFYQIIRVSAPQLSAGNVIVMKHASNVPQCAAAFEEIFRKAGAPEGTFQNLYLSHEQSDHVIVDPRVRGVALTGSERAGAQVAAAAGKALKKSTLELGGSDAFIVLDDADVKKAAKWAAFGRNWNAGQVCVSSKRLIVADSVYDEFVETYRELASELVAGDPTDPTTTLAPLSSREAVDRLQKQLDEAVAHGAKAEKLGKPVPEEGFFFQPMMVTDIAEDNPAYQAEFFGPIAQVYRVPDEATAIKLANDSPYGLGGSVFTKDVERGRRVARQLDTGMVFINQPTKVAADIPFGGVKRSGYGHELIDLGIHEFVNQKVVGVCDIDGTF
jgi:succinate-semialdehyde dehydrogenase/glutarate-semialdehyde dehydrogenase